MAAGLLATSLTLLHLSAHAAPNGRLDRAWLSDAPSGTARTSFPADTRVVYVNADYHDMAGEVVEARVMDDAGTLLITATATLTASGRAVLGLDSVVVVDRAFDALIRDGAALVTEVDLALAGIDDVATRYQHTQAAVIRAARMRGSVGTLANLPLAADARAALAAAADDLARAGTDGAAALAAADAAAARPHLEAMRAAATGAAGHVATAQSAAGGGAYAFPPNPDCRPYLVNFYVDGALSQSLDLAIGEEGHVAEVRVTPHRAVLVAGSPDLRTSSVDVEVVDGRCAPVPDGTLVTFGVTPADLAAIAPVTATTTAGHALAIVRALGPAGSIVVVAEAGGARGSAALRIEGGPPGPPATIPPTPDLPPPVTAAPTSPPATATEPPATPTEPPVPPPSTPVNPPPSPPIPPSTPATPAPTPVGPTVAPTAEPPTAPAPTDTPVPPTEPPPTVTPTPAPRPACGPAAPRDALCNARLVVEVFRDDGCDGRAGGPFDRRLGGVPVTIAFANGYVETVATSTGGTAYFGAVALMAGESLGVSAALPAGSRLCYNSYENITLAAGDFGDAGYARVTVRTR